MRASGRLLGFGAVLLLLVYSTGLSWGASPRYELYGHARLVAVETPNIVKLRMVGRDNLVTARLLGVGSPRNKDRIKDLGPEGLTYIQRHDLWEVSRNCVKSLVDHRVVEVWTRKWDRYDDKNRLLVYILIPDESGKPLDVNAEIIRRGLGFVTRDYVHVTFVGYRNLEQQAREHRLGIWGVFSKDRVSSLVR